MLEYECCFSLSTTLSITCPTDFGSVTCYTETNAASAGMRSRVFLTTFFDWSDAWLTRTLNVRTISVAVLSSATYTRTTGKRELNRTLRHLAYHNAHTQHGRSALTSARSSKALILVSVSPTATRPAIGGGLAHTARRCKGLRVI